MAGVSFPLVPGKEFLQALQQLPCQCRMEINLGPADEWEDLFCLLATSETCIGKVNFCRFDGLHLNGEQFESLAQSLAHCKSVTSLTFSAQSFITCSVPWKFLMDAFTANTNLREFCCQGVPRLVARDCQLSVQRNVRLHQASLLLDSSKVLPLGIWPHALHRLARRKGPPHGAAVYKILQVKMADWTDVGTPLGTK